MWSIIKELKQIKGVFHSLLSKLTKLIGDKRYSNSMSSLNINELLIIFEAMEKHKVNNEKALKLMLILFSPHLQNMSRS